MAQIPDRQSAPWHLPWPQQGRCHSRPLCTSTLPGTERRGVVKLSTASAMTAHHLWGRGSGASSEVHGVARSNGRFCGQHTGLRAPARAPIPSKTLLAPPEMIRQKGQANAWTTHRDVCLAVHSLGASMSIDLADLVASGIALHTALANLIPSIAGSRCVPPDSSAYLSRSTPNVG
jgi:hypothetical protein